MLFVGHGTPMNAIVENEFAVGFREVAARIPQPKAILCISAHWETRGNFVTALAHPPTLHDFGSFPKELFEVQYPAPGSPSLAAEVGSLVRKTEVLPANHWGLDHGAWSVLRHMYPLANIPVVQLSLNYFQNAREHFEWASELKSLREKGVLIIGSGNMVHNLRLMAWERLGESFGFDWAVEANEKMKQLILNHDHQSLIQYKKQGRPIQLAIPTPEHYLPLLYSLAVTEEEEEVILFNDKLVGGSISMTSALIG